MDLKLVVVILIGIFSQKEVQAVVTISDPTGGNGAAASSIPEDNTAATDAHTVVATAGGTLDATPTITSIDGLSVSADYKFEFNNLVLRAKAGANLIMKQRRNISLYSNAEVGIYPAHDMDGSAAKRVTSYAITGGDDAGVAAKFQISSDGVITRTAVALDAATKSSYPLVIEARGPTNTGTTTISVTVGGSCPGCGSSSGAVQMNAGVATMIAAILYNFI